MLNHETLMDNPEELDDLQIEDRWTNLEQMTPEQRRSYFNRVKVPPKKEAMLQKRGGTPDLRMKENR